MLLASQCVQSSIRWCVVAQSIPEILNTGFSSTMATRDVGKITSKKQFYSFRLQEVLILSG